MKDEGKKNREVAKELNVTTKTVLRWIKQWNEKGLEGFKPQKPKGKPPKLSQDKWKEIRNTINNKTPKDYDTDLWDTKTIRIFIKDTRRRIRTQIHVPSPKKKGVSSANHTQKK